MKKWTIPLSLLLLHNHFTTRTVTKVLEGEIFLKFTRICNTLVTRGVLEWVQKWEGWFSCDAVARLKVGAFPLIYNK